MKQEHAGQWRGRLLDLATIAAVIGALTVGGISAWDRFVAPARAAAPATIRDWRTYAEVGNRSGPADAPVTVVYFGDYQCPYCRMMAPRLDSLHAEFPAEVVIVHRHWPLPNHSAAYSAARAAECAGAQGHFATYNTLLYSGDAWMEDFGLFEHLAVEAKVEDIEAFRECVMESKPVESIERDILAVRELGGRGTPTILINDKLQRTLPTLEDLRTMVREAAGSRN